MSNNKKTHYGHAKLSVQTQGKEPDEILVQNRSHPFNDVHVFEAFVRTGRWVNNSRFGLRVAFRRHSSLRPYVENLRHRGRRIDANESALASYENAIDQNGNLGSGPDGIAGSTIAVRTDDFSGFYRDYGRNYTLNNTSCPIGSMVISANFNTNSELSNLPESQIGAWGEEALSEVDLPQNTIGNIFKHPIASTAWFNAVGEVSLSQGQILLSGTYNPPEETLHHAGFSIYYAKSGGTGVIQGAVKTTGETFPAGTSASRFRDTTFNGFIAGDVGKFIAIHGRGIYLITAFVDSANVNVDCVAINESFTNQSSLTWTLRTGPIGEYYWRRRPYFKFNNWVNYISGAANLYSMSGFDEILASGRTNIQCIPQRLVYDGLSHWWWTTPNRPAPHNQYGLLRQLHLSPQPFQAPVVDGSLTGFISWGAHEATGRYEDIIVDKNKKLWVSAFSPALTGNVLAKINPAPGGNAATPTVESLWKKQANSADTTGLTSAHIVAMCDDQSGTYSGGPGTHRIWAIGGNSEAGSIGGLNYSDDDGVTWKRIHSISASLGFATANNGSSAVTGAATTFLTDLAVGDWVRFSSDNRSYLITAIADNLSMTISPAYQGTSGSGKAVQRGGLNSNQNVCLTGYSHQVNGTDTSDGQHCIDWDTNGNVYWISQAGHICRWNESTGQCISFNQTSIPAVSPLAAISAATTPIGHLKVSRIPNVAGAGVHPFHNDVWLGCKYVSGTDTTTGGWIRVRADQVWTATPTAVNFTRYHYNNTITNSFPSIVRVPKDGVSQFLPRNTSVIVEPKTGNIALFSTYGEGTPGFHWLSMTGSAANEEFWRPQQQHFYGSSRGSSSIEGWRRSTFDEEGMGMGCCITPQDTGGVFATETEPPMAMFPNVWMDRRWNGSQWLPGLVNQNFADANLRGGSNLRTFNAGLGSGFRRVHEWSRPLVDGLNISFLQAGGAVAQSDEFMADETSTFVCAIGAMKDNTQTCTATYQLYSQPTVYRSADEAIKSAKNLWTVDDGIEGGYSSNPTGSLTFSPPFSRGVTDYIKKPAGGGLAPGYLAINAQAISNLSANHAMAVLRCPDQIELTTASWTGGTDIFNISGGYTFSPTDIGKSIIIEGANGATVDPDNGQAVIIAFNSATQVQVDKTFTTTRTARRWKLRDIPAVGFIEIGFSNTLQSNMKCRWRHDLWSSKDYGQNWSLAKYSAEGNNSLPDNGPDDVSQGVWFSVENGDRDSGFANLLTNFTNGNSVSTGCSIIFDLRDLPENVRRRQYWKWRMFDPDALHSGNSTFAGMFVYDSNFQLMNRPINNKIDDAEDSLFLACNIDKVQLIRAGGTGASPIDDGNSDGLTNLINVSGSLHLASGINNAQLTSAGRFIRAGAAFTRVSIGNYIKISGAVNQANNGWAIITGFISGDEVQTSKSFVNETNTFLWVTTSFGPGDELRIDSSFIPNYRGVPLNDVYFTVADIPSSGQIQTLYSDVPHPITAANWEVGRELNRYSLHPSTTASADTNNNVFFDKMTGTVEFGYDVEFVLVQQSTVSATTPADDDGDGRTDIVVVGEALTAADGPVPGDMIEILHATYGRRILEIVSVTGTDPNKNIKVKYDELPVSLTAVTWKIFRRRNQQYRVQRLTVVGKGAQVT